MTDALQELGLHIETKRPDCVVSWAVSHGELTVTIAPSSLVGFVDFLKTDSTCTSLPSTTRRGASGLM